MSLGLGGFVILLLSTLLPFSGTFNLSVNQGLYSTLGMVSAKKVRESQNSGSPSSSVQSSCRARQDSMS
jgi:hypothetical protein